MKKLLFIAIVIFWTSMMMAQYGNNGFNYKALITQNGNPVANQNVTLRLTILQGSNSDYQETHATTTDANGIVSVVVGEGNVVSGNFDNIQWQGLKNLKVEIKIGNGSYQNYGTNELKSVPYAKFANQAIFAANAGSMDFGNLTNVPTGLADGDDVNDADHSTTNELQNLSISGNSLSISNGNTVTLPAGSSGDADFYKANTTTPPTSINDNIYTMGRLGIGTNIPGANLEVKGTDAKIKLNNGTVSGGFWRFNNVFAIYSEDKLGMGIATGGGVTIDMQISHNGNIGMGTTNPVGRLNVIPAGNLSSGNSLPNFNNAGLLVGTNTNGIALDANQIESKGNLYINHNSDNSIFLVDGGGKVGIGTYNPAEKLEIKSSNNNVGVKIIAGDTKKSKLKLMESGNYGYELEYDGANDELNLWSKHYTGNEAIRTTWKKNGEVQINGKLTSSATGSNDLKAFAYGNISSTGSIQAGTGNFSVDHGVGAGVFKITFDNVNYDTTNFVTVVTVRDVYWPSFIFCYASNNTLVVKIFDADGTTKEDQNFSFVTYKK